MLVRAAWSARRVGDALGCVVLEQRLEEHAHRAEHADKHKDPQKEAVDHHGNVLPVLADLRGGTTKERMKRNVEDEHLCNLVL